MISEAALLAASQCAYKDMQERAVVIQAVLDEARREERASVIAEADQWTKGITYGPGIDEEVVRGIKSLFDVMLILLGRPASAPEGEQ